MVRRVSLAADTHALGPTNASSYIGTQVTPDGCDVESPLPPRNAKWPRSVRSVTAGFCLPQRPSAARCSGRIWQDPRMNPFRKSSALRVRAPPSSPASQTEQSFWVGKAVTSAGLSVPFPRCERASAAGAVRLACVRHAASVRPGLGSDPPIGQTSHARGTPHARP